MSNVSALAGDCCLGADPGDVEHLLTQAQVFAGETSELLDLIGLGAGANVIDVGCGALGILPLLRGRVREAGRVVGLDIEPSVLAIGRQMASQLGLTVETVRADAIDMGLPGASFDLVHERGLLLNNPDPVAVVAEMVRLVCGGGTVALQEPDSASWVCDPPHPAWDVVRSEVLAVYPRTGRISTPAGAPPGFSAPPG
jgi:ubiquinone/menaquinone biosynthesis C-methylase UbiE